jgi:hypothetical protein
LLNGVAPLTATAGGGTNALLGDIKKLVAAIAPAIRPVIIVNSVQAASIGILSQSPLPVIAAPTLAADQIIAVDAAAFASSLGAPDFSIRRKSDRAHGKHHAAADRHAGLAADHCGADAIIVAN